MYRYAGMLLLGFEERSRQMGAIGFVFHTALPCHLWRTDVSPSFCLVAAFSTGVKTQIQQE